jgi:hypothetical protein
MTQNGNFKILYLDNSEADIAKLRETLEEFWTPAVLTEHWNQTITKARYVETPRPTLITNVDLTGAGSGGLRRLATDLFDNDRQKLLVDIDVVILDELLGVGHWDSDITISGHGLAERIQLRYPNLQPIILSTYAGTDEPPGLDLLDYQAEAGERLVFPKRLVIGYDQSERYVARFFMYIIKFARQRRLGPTGWNKDRYYDELMQVIENRFDEFSTSPLEEWKVGNQPSKRKFVEGCSRELLERYGGRIPSGIFPRNHNPQVILRQISRRDKPLFRRLEIIDPNR